MQKGLIRHPSFQLAATAVIILIVSIFFRANKNILADLFLIAAILLVGINWIIILRLIMRHPFFRQTGKIILDGFRSFDPGNWQYYLPCDGR